MSEPQQPFNANQTAAEHTQSLQAAGMTQDLKPGDGARSSTAPVQVPGYKIIGLLGRGGMGVVYKAVQEKANRLVALKMILAGAHADQHDQVRFRVEAEAVAKLSHPNIVQLYEVGETPDGFPFFSLEFVSGGTLADRLKQGPLRPSEAAVLIEAMARAMQYAHESGIVHRDLKPLNILLEGGRPSMASDTMIKDRAARTINTAESSSTGSSPSQSFQGPRPIVPKISDFGLAKQLDSEDGLTRTGAIMGSPSYMAPEQAFGQSKHVGPAADIYALGAILYECLTGRPPFKGATIADTLEQVRTMEPISARAFAKEIPADLETICLHCLHKEPLRRYPTAEALAEDLLRYREGQPITVRPVNSFERTWRWCKRHPGSASAIGILIAFVLVVIAGLTYINVETNALNAKIVAETKLAKERQQQSMLALGLAMTEIRDLAEDTMVPAKQRTKLLAKLIAELQKQVDENATTHTIDSVRSNSYLYTVLATAENESAIETDKSTWIHADNARSWCNKGLKMVDHWLELAPGDPLALSRRGTLLALMGSTFGHSFVGDPKKAKEAYFAEALEIRRKLAGDPEAVKIVDQFTPGKAKSELAESLENARRYEEAFRVHDDLCREHPTDLRYLNNRAWAFAKAAAEENDRAKKKAYLREANQMYAEMSERLQGTGQFTRQLFVRWAATTSRMVELENSQNRPDEAQKQLEKYVRMAQHLSTSSEGAKYHSATTWAHYELARLQINARQNALLVMALDRSGVSLPWSMSCFAIFDRQARASLDAVRLRLELLQADYPRNAETINSQISLCRLQLYMGELAQAIRGADSLHLKFSDAALNDNLAYRLACFYSVCIPKIAEARGNNALTADDKKQQADCRDKALQWLDNAFKQGHPHFEHARKHDPDMVPIRGDARFEQILKKHEKK